MSLHIYDAAVFGTKTQVLVQNLGLVTLRLLW